MKKIISILITAVILMTAMTVYSAATESDPATYNYQIDDTEYTVEFANNNIPAEQQEMIAQKLVGLDGSSAQPYGLGCILFGHDYLYDTVYVIYHKQNKYNPRCKEETYDVKYCEDCDFTEETLVAIGYINCCPED